MSETRLLEIAERIDILNDRMVALLELEASGSTTDDHGVPTVVVMDAICEEYDSLFAEAERLGVSE